MGMRITLWAVCVGLALTATGRAADKPTLSDYFPPPESKGGWKSEVPAKGEPDEKQKAAITKLGVDYDLLKKAWDYNAGAEGATGLIVIRKGTVVGEWYRDCDAAKTFNIYSSSKAYTSLAFGLLLADSDA